MIQSVGQITEPHLQIRVTTKLNLSLKIDHYLFLFYEIPPSDNDRIDFTILDQNYYNAK